MYQASVVELTVQKQAYNRMLHTQLESVRSHHGEHNTMRSVKHQDLFKQIYLFTGGGEVETEQSR